MDKRVYQLEMKSGAAQHNCALAEFLCYQFFPIWKFSYKFIICLLHSYIIKSDDEIGKYP